jgi:tetratricopeptide (TPR) repeat protein
VGTQGEDGEVPARLTPIFRDRDDLPAAGDLSEKVRAALAVSRNLIVLCSPNSSASPWVAKEISTFRELHPGRPIFTAIVAGEPGQCFSPALLVDGSEPLAADLRKEGDGRRLGLLKLVAGIAGVGLDALVQRDAQRRIQRVTTITSAAIFGMLTMALMTVFALNARAEAQRQRNEAEGLVEFMLTDLRDKLKGVSSLKVLTAVNERALDYYQKQDLTGLPPDSLERRARLLHALGEDDQKRGDLDRALAQFLEARRTTGALVAAEPGDPDRIFAHSQSEYWVGSVSEQKGDYPAAAAAYRRYLLDAAKMNRLAPANPKFVGEVAYAQSNLGSVALNGLKAPEIARRHFIQSLRWFERASVMQPEKRVWREEVGDAHAWIAATWYSQRRLAEARAEHLRELRIKQQLLDGDPTDQTLRYAVVITARSLARIEQEDGKLGRALAFLVPAREKLDALMRADPDNLVWRDQATRLMLDLARVHYRARAQREASVALAEAEALLAYSEKTGSEPIPLHRELRRSLAELKTQIRRSGSKPLASHNGGKHVDTAV